MEQFKNQWNRILAGDSKNQVDIISSIHEDGINFFLEKSFEIDQTLPDDQRKYRLSIERTFDTFSDPRKFKVTIELQKSLLVKFPPFSTLNRLSDDFGNITGWSEIDYPTDGPELIAKAEDETDGVIEVLAREVAVEMQWPNLDPTKPDHKWSIPPFNVLGQAKIQLEQEGSEFFAKIIPTLIKIDIPRTELKAQIIQILESNSSSTELIEESDCEEKFVDLFIIAANIAAYEQTPKLVTSINLPIPTINDRPVQPAAFDISNDMLSVGFGIDKVVLEKYNEEAIESNSQKIDYLLNQDVEDAGGLLKAMYRNAEGKSIKTSKQLLLRDEKEIEQNFKNINGFIADQEKWLNQFEAEDTVHLTLDDGPERPDSFAIGINEYFFDTIVNSVIPKPKHRCEKERRLGPVKGYICHWSSFRNPDISVNADATLKGNVSVNLGGSIHACVKKFWDCSWRWACSKLALAIAGRPGLKVKILSANGVRVLGQFDAGGLRIVSNLPFPFNKIVEALSSLIFKFVVAFANVLAILLSFYVLKPEFVVDSLNLKLKLKNFSSFYFERSNAPSADKTKNKFIAFKTNISVSKL
ncbi:hypothetical protein QQ020_14470 [Fulvivirgaceae bacterium BMA12]|uniref:Uncharacterized protein n=1 Tax=Agaribacillus aureus TaxID=3051825 RepID=A0ABT8L686_9BACT|nr:hypothetical protein [Fulvivirgaceae bacterium BMA12]